MLEVSEIRMPSMFLICSIVVLMVSTLEDSTVLPNTCIYTAGLWTLASAGVLRWFMFNSWFPPHTLGLEDYAYYCQPFQSLHAGKQLGSRVFA